MNKHLPKAGSCRAVEQQLRSLAREDKAEFLPRFLQAYPGGYGEGDKLFGVVVPDQRKVARNFKDLPLDELEKLLDSPWHECRLTGLFILVSQFERASKAKAAGSAPETEPRKLMEFYLANLDGVNNWDLVDASAHKILGAWVLENPKQTKILFKLARSKQLWRERVSVIATFTLIRANQFDEILDLAERFLTHKHDLMHKAVGWMLREMGKRDVNLLRGFLTEHVHVMPRTMLRYSIEKLDKSERDKWLKK